MIKLSFLLFLVIIPSGRLLSQTDTVFAADSFNIRLNDKILSVQNINGIEIYAYEFINPSGYLSDLDIDGINEFLVKDMTLKENKTEYQLHIFNLIDTFYLAEVINSGITEPYETFSAEIEGLIIVSGNTDFSYLNDYSEYKMIPVNCWKYEDGEIFSVNEELYEIFISENDNILSMIDTAKTMEDMDCSSSAAVKSLIASAYINYLNAGEMTSAESLLKTYYVCSDMEKFKTELDNLFYREKK